MAKLILKESKDDSNFLAMYAKYGNEYSLLTTIHKDWFGDILRDSNLTEDQELELIPDE